MICLNSVPVAETVPLGSHLHSQVPSEDSSTRVGARGTDSNGVEGEVWKVKGKWAQVCPSGQQGGRRRRGPRGGSRCDARPWSRLLCPQDSERDTRLRISVLLPPEPGRHLSCGFFRPGFRLDCSYKNSHVGSRKFSLASSHQQLLRALCSKLSVLLEKLIEGFP